jgi:hypothetical protein
VSLSSITCHLIIRACIDSKSVVGRHPIFEKGWQLLRQSSAFSNYDLTWAGGSCYGTGWNDTMPFKGLMKDPDRTTYYTNSELWTYLDPTNTALPYV